MNDFQKNVINVLAEHSPVWIVGGAIRDKILGLEAKDLDLVSPLKSDDVENILREKGFNSRKIGNKFSTVSVFDKDNRIDIVQTDDLREDALKRDFTVNAIYFNPFTNQIFDPFSGIRDLNQKIIRTCDTPLVTFRNDPIRILRMVKLAVKYKMEIDNNTWEESKALIALLVGAPKERVTAELAEILVLDEAEKAIRFLDELEYWDVFIPELARLKGLSQNEYHSLDVWEHTLAVLKNTPQNLFLRLAGLFHDIGKWEVASHECYVTGKLEHNNGCYYIEGYKIIGTKGYDDLNSKLENLIGEKIKILGAKLDQYSNIIQLKRVLKDKTGTNGLSLIENGKRHFLNHEKAGAEIIKDILKRYSFSMFFEGEGQKKERDLLYLVEKHMAATLTFMPEFRGEKTKNSFRDRAAELMWDICWDGKCYNPQMAHDFLLLWKADYQSGKVHTEKQNSIFEEIFKELLNVSDWQKNNINKIKWEFFTEFTVSKGLTGPDLGNFKNYVRRKSMVEMQTDLDPAFLEKIYKEYMVLRERGKLE